MNKAYLKKFEHAQGLASELRKTVAELISNTRIICDDSSGRAVYSIEESETKSQIQDRVSLLVGDILHNLRSSLDYVAYGEFKDNPESTLREDRIYFPILDSKEDFEAKKTYLINISKAFHNILQNDVKPYKEVNYKLWVLDKLNNISKHREMILVLNRSEGVDLGIIAANELKRINPDIPDGLMDKISLMVKPVDCNLNKDNTLLIDAPDSKCTNGFKATLSLNLVEETCDVDERLVILILDLIDEVKLVLDKFS